MVEKMFSLWQFFPEWMYQYLSSRGRELYKHLNVMHNFTSKVTYITISKCMTSLYVMIKKAEPLFYSMLNSMINSGD